jgi:hypothetical protein
MRTIRGSLALLGVALVALLAGQLVNTTAAKAAPAPVPLEVVEQNLDLAGRIQVSLPNVDETGRLLVVAPEQEQPEPVQNTGIVALSPGEFNSCAVIYEVPEGRRLTLDFVSVAGYITGDDNAATATIRANIEVAIPMASTHTQGGTEATTPESPMLIYWAGTESVQAFGFQGNLVACGYVRNAVGTFADEAFFNFRWSGHLD